MANKARLMRLAEAHGGTDKPAEAPSEKPEIDLDDHATQERILNPEGTDVELSYGKIRVYPPSAMMRRLAYGFCTEILADSAENKPSDANIFSMRVMSKLMSAPGPQLRLINLTAYLCGKPGAIDEATALKLGAEIGESATPDDMAVLFAMLCSAAGMKAAPTGTAKNPKSRTT